MITPAQAGAEFAEVLVRLAAAEHDRDPELSAYLADAADFYCPPSAHRSSARVRLAMAGLGRQESAR